MKLNVKLSKSCTYSVHEEVDSTIISIGSLNWQQNYESPTRTNVSYIFNNKNKKFLNNDQQQMKVEEVVGLYIYNSTYKQRKEIRQKILINKQNKNLKKLLSKKTIEVGEKDYAFFINQNKIISGIYNTNICFCSGQESQSKIRKRYSQQKCIEFKDRYVTGMTKMDDTSLLLTYTNQKNEDLYNFLSTYFCVYDVQSQIAKWIYSKPRQAITSNPLKIDKSCFLVGHLDLHENSADLILHDTRLQSYVCILDTSRQEFGTASWMPYYRMLYKLSPWEVATVWGGPAGKINHIIKLDLRFPLQRQIIVKSIEHPKYFHQSTYEKEQYWMIRNQYEGYRYKNTIIEKKKKFERILQ